MRKGIVLLTLAALVVLVFPIVTSATEADQGPPKVLQIFREQVKPGMSAAHEKFETGFPQAFTKANWPTHYLAITSISGPSEAWFLTGYDSVAAAEKDTDATRKQASFQSSLDELSRQDAQFLTGTRGLIAVLRENLSYGKGPGSIAEKRYFRIYTVQVRPGRDEEFKESREIVKAAHEKAQLNEHFAVYQVVAGAPQGTYLIFLPMKSLQEVDSFDDVHGKAYKEALGEDGQKRLRELTSTSIETSDAECFEFSPKMSYVSKEWIAANPSFWAPQQTVATGATKKAPETKAVKKEKE